MGTFVKGDIVILPFPYSDLSNSKKRPALVITQLRGNDVILCQITSAIRDDNYSIELNRNHFSSGNLRINSYIRPNQIFTADPTIIDRKAGKLRQSKLDEVINKIIEIISS